MRGELHSARKASGLDVGQEQNSQNVPVCFVEYVPQLPNLRTSSNLAIMLSRMCMNVVVPTLTLLLRARYTLASPLNVRQDPTITGDGQFKCTYDILPAGMQVGFAIVKQLAPAKSFADCINICDNSTNCVAASYHPQRADRACVQADTLSFSYANLRHAKHDQVQTGQIVPSSCSKPAAKLIPLDCSVPAGVDEIFIPQDGVNQCSYNITCGAALPSGIETFYGQYPTFVDCLTECDDLEECFAVTYYEGGDCHFGGSYGFANATYVLNSNAESAQIIEGSCNKTAAMS